MKKTFALTALTVMLVAVFTGAEKIMEKKQFKQGPKAVIETSMGTIELELYKEKAPLTVENFIKKTNAGDFDGCTFHRIVPNFVIQGGDPNSKDNDPNNDGYGGGRMPSEPRKLSNLRGTISMASSSRAKPIDSQSDMQFFININDNLFLDEMGFIPFGKVVKGMETADEIVKQPRDQRDRPIKNITFKKITIKQ